ncbi:hypothetical protein GCM10011579_093790 [Streptomyces albiflavescens]|uniref:DUF6879 domain-containing protein n=1 Tax=Streptomyces albiflavescens TaxID=1623582 RepID=A0A917YHK3_9ACTN|nr:DUF6879 family protein [Streptomyces albiflavescens]GGN94370.1 hypothetical protein GCM10011579_093790 [Streptomyces albiflavescens]
MPQKVPPFAELLAGCRRSAVHLEMRDVYGVAEEDEDFASWLAGHRYDLADRATWWNDFHTTAADAVSRGVVVRRARVVSEPVSDYIRFEHSCTPQNIAAGEDVRWLPRRLASDLLLPGNDLWLFDGRLIRFGLFSGDGAFVGHAMEDAPDVVKRHAEAFEAVWERAIPHEDFRI